MPALLRSVWNVFRTLFRWIGIAVGWLLAQVFGKLNWSAPWWARKSGVGIARLGRWGVANPKRGALTLLIVAGLAAGGWYGWRWYQSLPKPLETTYQVTAPPLTPWDNDQPQPQPLTVEFSEAVAPLANIGKPVTTGLELSPKVTGEWHWETDRKLLFQPKTDWPVDAEFEVSMAKKGLFTGGVELDEYSFNFKSAPFEAKVEKAEFYQDPRDPNLKKLVATVHFSHPVEAAAFKDRVKLDLGGGLGFLGLGDAPTYSVSFDKPMLNAYVHSAPLAIPREDTPLTLTVKKGLKAARGGNELDSDLSSTITVPGLYSLKFTEVGMTLVDNERFEPEQVLTFTSSAPVSDDALKGKVHAWLLPEFHPDTPTEQRTAPYPWNASKVSKQILATAQALPLRPVPGEDEYSVLHGNKFDAPVGRYVYLTIDAGVQAFGGYQAGKATGEVVQVKPYPQAIKLLSQGSLLALSGEKKVAFVARGVPGVKIEVGRLLPNQLHHLVDQNNGVFSQPDVGEQFEDSLVERLVETRPLPAGAPGKPFYDNLDLSNYLNAGDGKRGVFLLRLTRWDPKNPKQDGSEVKDTRFVLVTDLGVIAKRAVDGAQDVFVQSITSGQPVSDAKVEVIGRNGLPVMAETTDAEGHVRFPSLRDFSREKQPLMYRVSHGEDLSFLPINRSDRRLDMSRFDVGGIENAVTPNQLSAFAFTDRGLYRPGETAHIAYIARTANWAGQLAGLPLEVEVVDPRGLPVHKQRMRLSAAGFESFDFETRDTSPTGDYTAAVYVVRNNQRDAQIGSVNFRVRDFEPDRLKVTATLTDAPTDGWVRPDDVHARVHALHLFGAAAGGRRVEAEMSLTPALPAFPRYKDYRFFDPGKLKEPFIDKLPGGKTDNDGNAELDLNLKRFARATYRLHLTARVFEAEGGRNVAAENAVMVSSQPFLVGVKADGVLDYIQRDAKRTAHWLAVAPNLDPTAADKLTLAFVERRFVSVLTKQPDGTYKYESRKKELTRSTQPLSLPKGGSELPLITGEPGDFALVVRDAEGTELNRLEYSVVGEANLTRSLERNAELQLTLNKTDYAPGDTIEVSLRAPYTGAGLITIERDKVVAHAWFKADTTSSVQKITLPKDFEGNGYVSVQFVRDPGSSEVYMSPLSYGVAPFAVNRDARKEKVTVDAPLLTKPGQPLSMKVTAAEPSRVAVFAVDEGILQVARYKTPDPLGFFFQKRALEVDTTQILDLILPEFARLMNGAAPGGDAEGALGRHLNPFKRKRQPSVAWWSGIQDIGPGGKTFRYDVPDTYNGKLRLVAVAVTNGRIGVYEGGTEVRGDLILSPNVPAFVAPGDEFTVSVGVFNNLKGGKAPVTVSLTPSRELSVVGDGKTTLTIPAQQEAVAEFKLRANAALGSASLQFLADAQGKRGKALDAISVRPPVAYRTQVSVGSFGAGAFTLPLSRNLYGEYRKVDAGLGSSPLVWANGLKAYLDGYAYSCTEQLVSKGFPALLLTPKDQLGHAKGLPELFDTLRERQNDDGSFGLWAANLQVEPFAAIYAAHFLLEAKERGAPVPNDVLANANGWLEQLAAGGSEGLEGARNRAYAIYLLTRQGNMTSGLIATLTQELNARYAKEWPQDLTAAYLAASYKLLQQDGVALQLLKRVPWKLSGKQVASDEVYYDPLVHDAQLLMLTSRHFRERLANIPPVELDQLGKTLSTNQYNSLSAALTMLALDSYGKANAGGTGKLTLSAQMANNSLQALTQSGVLPSAPAPVGTQKLKFEKVGGAPAYYLLSESGFDRTLPAGELKQGLEVVREYLTLDGKALTQVKVGEEFLVRLRLRATERDKVSQVAVVDLLPGGIEPVVEPPAEPAAEAQAAQPQDGEAEGEGEGEGEDAPAQPAWQSPVGVKAQSTWQPFYADIRDDRVVLYGTVARDAATFVYRVRATNAGTFQTPAPYVEGMYQRKLQGRGTLGKLEVVKP